VVRSAMGLALAAQVATAALAYAESDPIVASTEDLCPTEAHETILACLDAWYSDISVETAPLSLDTGIWMPSVGGIFATVQRHKRGADKSEIPVSDLPLENYAKMVEAGDPANTYRVLSADPTAQNLLLSITILAEEVFQMPPAEAPIAYLFLTKIVESTLHRSAVEDKRDIYASTEQFRNCLHLTLIDQQTDRLGSTCLPILSNAAGKLLGDE